MVCILVHLALPIVLWKKENVGWISEMYSALTSSPVRHLVCPSFATHFTWGLVNNKTLPFSHWECTHHLSTNMRTAISALRSVLRSNFTRGCILTSGPPIGMTGRSQIKDQWICRHCFLFFFFVSEKRFIFSLSNLYLWHMKACICYPIFCNEKTKQDLSYKHLGIWLI